VYEDAKWRTRQLLYLSEQVAFPQQPAFGSEGLTSRVLTHTDGRPSYLSIICLSMQTSGEEPNKLTIMMADVVKVSANQQRSANLSSA
jgi:hypothetical protein